MRRLLPLALLVPALAACAGGGRPYPSLDRRPAERMTGSASPVAAAPPAPVRTPPSGDLSARLAALRLEAQTAHGAFLKAEPGASRAVSAARGGAVASENWSVAQIAVAELDSARSRAMIAMADLDSLLVTAAVADAATSGGDLPAVQAVQAEVSGWIAEEDAVLQRLRGQLPG